MTEQEFHTKRIPFIIFERFEKGLMHYDLVVDKNFNGTHDEMLTQEFMNANGCQSKTYALQNFVRGHIFGDSVYMYTGLNAFNASLKVIVIAEQLKYEIAKYVVSNHQSSKELTIKIFAGVIKGAIGDVWPGKILVTSFKV
jgi:hypothetical protein